MLAASKVDQLGTRKLLAQVVEKLEDRIEQGPPLAAVQRCFPDLEIREQVGRGGMASVYKAWDPKLERHLAIKILDESLAEQPDFAERFAREAKTLASLQHPNVLRPLDYGARDGLFFIVSEYFGGGNLAQHLSDGMLSTESALSILHEVADALAYAHEQGIVHRDLKPSNILIDDAGHACLADFGIVRLLGERKDTVALTRTMQAMGTPHYLAPEMLQGEVAVSAGADIYSLGVMAYEMLTGRLPLGRFDPPSKHARVGSGVDAAIDRCLRPDPEDRWSSIGDFIAALDERVAPFEERPIWPRAWKWSLACLGVFALIEAMDILLRFKTGRWVLPPSFGAELAFVSLASGWSWLAIERVWPRVPREEWLRPVRGLINRWMRWSLLALAACALLLIVNTVINRLYPGEMSLLPFLVVRSHHDLEKFVLVPQVLVLGVALALFGIELFGPRGLSTWRDRKKSRANQGS